MVILSSELLPIPVSSQSCGLKSLLFLCFFFVLFVVVRERDLLLCMLVVTQFIVSLFHTLRNGTLFTLYLFADHVTSFCVFSLVSDLLANVFLISIWMNLSDNEQSVYLKFSATLDALHFWQHTTAKNVRECLLFCCFFVLHPPTSCTPTLQAAGLCKRLLCKGENLLDVTCWTWSVALYCVSQLIVWKKC